MPALFAAKSPLIQYINTPFAKSQIEVSFNKKNPVAFCEKFYAYPEYLLFFDKFLLTLGNNSAIL